MVWERERERKEWSFWWHFWTENFLMLNAENCDVISTSFDNGLNEQFDFFFLSFEERERERNVIWRFEISLCFEKFTRCRIQDRSVFRWRQFVERSGTLLCVLTKVNWHIAENCRTGRHIAQTILGATRVGVVYSYCILYSVVIYYILTSSNTRKIKSALAKLFQLCYVRLGNATEIVLKRGK